MLGKLRRDYTPFPSAPTEFRPRPSADLSGAIAAPSPARALQEELELRTMHAREYRWSARRRLAFIIASASTLWLAVIAAGTGLIYAVA